MSAETKKVLDMLAGGKITTEEADKLLEKLTTASADRAPSGEQAPGNGGSTFKPRFLRIQVERPGEEKVNLRIPIGLLGKGRGLFSVLPVRVGEKLAEHGIDLTGLASLNDGELADMLKEANIDVDKGNGKKVRIFCE